MGIKAPLKPKAGQSVPLAVRSVLRSPGEALPPQSASRLGRAFGQDFSGIRVHTDPAAAESARAIGAPAWAAGQHIAFASGFYAPETREGEALLAHELAHVVQQQGSPLPPVPQLRTPADPAEAAADRTAAATMAGQPIGPVGTAPAGLYRADLRRYAPPSTIPAGRRAIIQWGDDDATILNTRALATGARSGPNAAGADLVIHVRDLKPDSLKDVREVVVVIHGETDLDTTGRRAIEPGENQPKATHGAPGLPQHDPLDATGKPIPHPLNAPGRVRSQGPQQQVTPDAIADKLTSAGFGQGRWTSYRVRLAMCYAGVGKAESFSAKLSQSIGSRGVTNETLGYRGQVTAMGLEPTGHLQGPGPRQGNQPVGKPAEPGRLQAANSYPVYKGTTFGAPGTRVRSDITKASGGAPTPAAETPPVVPTVTAAQPSTPAQAASPAVRPNPAARTVSDVAKAPPVLGSQGQRVYGNAPSRPIALPPRRAR